MHHSVEAFTPLILLMWKNKKSAVKQVAKLKQCIVRSRTYSIYRHFRLSVLCSVLQKIN